MVVTHWCDTHFPIVLSLSLVCVCGINNVVSCVMCQYPDYQSVLLLLSDTNPSSFSCFIEQFFEVDYRLITIFLIQLVLQTLQTPHATYGMRRDVQMFVVE